VEKSEEAVGRRVVAEEIIKMGVPEMVLVLPESPDGARERGIVVAGMFITWGEAVGIIT
jgi:hypothetical protein